MSEAQRVRQQWISYFTSIQVPITDRALIEYLGEHLDLMRQISAEMKAAFAIDKENDNEVNESSQETISEEGSEQDSSPLCSTGSPESD